MSNTSDDDLLNMLESDDNDADKDYNPLQDNQYSSGIKFSLKM